MDTQRGRGRLEAARDAHCPRKIDDAFPDRVFPANAKIADFPRLPAAVGLWLFAGSGRVNICVVGRGGVTCFGTDLFVNKYRLFRYKCEWKFAFKLRLCARNGLGEDSHTIGELLLIEIFI